MVDEEIRRYAKVLEAVVKLSELSTRELERRLDLGGGTLNRLFTGKIDLKLRHILQVLEVVGMKPERFFQLACAHPHEPDAGASALAAEILESFQRFGYSLGRPPAAPPSPVTDEELDRRIEAALGRVLRRAGREPDAPPSAATASLAATAAEKAGAAGPAAATKADGETAPAQEAGRPLAEEVEGVGGRSSG
jgi:AcrR family transcriptional regulator